MSDTILKNGLVIYFDFFGSMGVSTSFHHISNRFVTYSFEDLVDCDFFLIVLKLWGF